MISTLIARVAMVTSLAYYSLSLAVAWGAALFGNVDSLWDLFDIPLTFAPPPTWIMVIGIMLSLGLIMALGTAYWSIEKILRGGQGQDFLQLSQRLKRTAIGLMLFWLGYNLLTGFMPLLVTQHLPVARRPEWDWDVLDVHIIILIVGIALFAISHALHRAWAVEEENKQFL